MANAFVGFMVEGLDLEALLALLVDGARPLELADRRLSLSLSLTHIHSLSLSLSLALVHGDDGREAPDVNQRP